MIKTTHLTKAHLAEQATRTSSLNPSRGQGCGPTLQADTLRPAENPANQALSILTSVYKRNRFNL